MFFYQIVEVDIVKKEKEILQFWFGREKKSVKAITFVSCVVRACVQAKATTVKCFEDSAHKFSICVHCWAHRNFCCCCLFPCNLILVSSANTFTTLMFTYYYYFILVAILIGRQLV